MTSFCSFLRKAGQQPVFLLELLYGVGHQVIQRNLALVLAAQAGDRIDIFAKLAQHVLLVVDLAGKLVCLLVDLETRSRADAEFPNGFRCDACRNYGQDAHDFYYKSE